MRAFFVFALGLALIALPAAAQEAGGKTKPAPSARTVVEGLRMSTGLDALNAFIEAYAASDYVSAYYLLSPDAKMDFLNRVNEYNYAVLFPDLESHAPTGSIFDINTDTAKDLVTDVTPDGALMFDDLMITAERQGVLPFDLSEAVVTSPTIDLPDQGRYLVGTGGDPSVVIISTIRLSNGDWRIERVVWAASDPDARPWGRK